MGADIKRLESSTMAKKKALIIVIVLGVLSFVFLIAGIIFFVKGSKKSEMKAVEDHCDYSEEARRVGLPNVLQKTQNTYFEMHPERYYDKEGISVQELKRKYKAYDPSPEKIKLRTDTARKLYKEIENTQVNFNAMKQREIKAFFQLKFFVKFVFSTPFGGDYYAGDWMMGPDGLCFHPICNIPNYINNNLQHFKPSTVEEMEEFQEKLKEVNQTFFRYIDNLKLGITAGMVETQESCYAGLQAVISIYENVYRKGEGGIFDEYYVQSLLDSSFLSKMQGDIAQLMLWRQKYRELSVTDSLRNFLLIYLGRPIHTLLRYLETEYKSHCVPSTVSSGLSSLPLPYVYVNGIADKTRPTTQKLPTGEGLNGSKAYETILSYFTTTNLTPDEVHDIGVKTVDKLYPQVLNIARKVTGQSNNTLAKQDFTKKLDQSDMYYNDVPIPKNESDKNAHNTCISVETAKKHCPVRWRAMNKWFSNARQTMALLEAKISKLFYFTGKYKTTPSCPAELSPDFNPASGAQSYKGSDAACEYTSTYFIPFFLEKPGPKYAEWSINAHEVMPGHHLQLQAQVEHFMDPCKDLISWVQSVTGDSYTAIDEGWGLYAENPVIAQDTDLYNDEPLYKYGMLKWQIWRALRLVVDTGLHYKSMTKQQAIQKFEEFAWASGDVVSKEVVRYQSSPGQAAAYMIGQRELIRLRDMAQKELGPRFNLKDFHYNILSQGSAPLNYYENVINRYISCVKKPFKSQECNFAAVPKPTTFSDKLMRTDVKKASLQFRRKTIPRLRKL